MIQLGYFGKTIHRGDFVRFNLPKAFITVMDDWLQSVMINGESVHADQWPHRYMTCPGYRFDLSPDIAGDHRWSGVMAASTDKVGRRFPFCIAAGLPDSLPPPWARSELSDAMSRLTSLLTQIQAPDYNFEALQDELAVVSQSLSDALESSVQGEFHKSGMSDPEQFSLVTKGEHPGVATAATGSILDTVLHQAYVNHSIWSPINKSPAFRGLVTSGLPDEKAALALFDNTWESVKGSTLDTPFQSVLHEPALVPDEDEPVDTDSSSFNDADINTHDIDQTEPDKDAWQALDENDPSKQPSHPDPQTIDDDSTTAPQPRIEPLELEEDSSTKAPWD